MKAYRYRPSRLNSLPNEPCGFFGFAPTPTSPVLSEFNQSSTWSRSVGLLQRLLVSFGDSESIGFSLFVGEPERLSFWPGTPRLVWLDDFSRNGLDRDFCSYGSGVGFFNPMPFLGGVLDPVFGELSMIINTCFMYFKSVSTFTLVRVLESTVIVSI